MDDYISCAAAIVQKCDCEAYDSKTGMIFECDAVPVERINVIHPADVRPVKQGEWMMMVDSIFNGERFVEWTCSECGYVRNRGWRHTNDGKAPDAKFCENCGAKMKEEKQ